MKYDKPIVSIDVESTGVDPVQDKIVSLSAVRYFPYNPDGAISLCDSRHWIVNPWRPIPAEATEVHGITDAMVANAPGFRDVAEEFWEFTFDAGIILGYNLFRFDLLILQQEFAAADICPNVDEYKQTKPLSFPPPDALIIDAYNIFAKKEKRDLAAAVEKYCGVKHESAHNSLADAKATFAVLMGQLDTYADLAALSMAEVAAFSRHDDMVDYAGKLRRNKKGEVVYGIGKAKDVPVLDDPGFGNWMLRQAWITEDTRKHLVAALEADRIPFTLPAATEQE